jgi:aspartyl-tRNA(Asn)/glutamyl-tRNA(Gln) amidotransferase subunit C
MDFPPVEIEYIASLARLELTPEEVERYGRELAAILGYIEQLQGVDTKDIVACAQVTDQENVWRADEVHSWDQTEVAAALAQAPLMRDGQIEVKRVL